MAQDWLSTPATPIAGTPGTLTPAQASAVSSMSAGAGVSVTLDGSNRPATITKGSRTLTVAWADATHLSLSLPNAGGQPASTAALVVDASGRLISVSTNY